MKNEKDTYMVSSNSFIVSVGSIGFGCKTTTTAETTVAAETTTVEEITITMYSSQSSITNYEETYVYAEDSFEKENPSIKVEHIIKLIFNKRD